MANKHRLRGQILMMLAKDMAFPYAEIWNAARMLRSARDENPNHDPENGQFTEGPGGASGESKKQPEDISGLLGKEHKGAKGQAAIDLLLKEKNGHIKGAFHRDDIGDIDLLWGDENAGLQHIIQQRQKQGVNISEFMSNLSTVVEDGNIRKANDRGNFEIFHKGKVAVVSPELWGTRLAFLLTAFKTHSKK